MPSLTLPALGVATAGAASSAAGAVGAAGAAVGGASTLSTLGAIGTGISATGSILGGISQANAARYQGQVAANNATIANQNAAYAASAGAAQTEQAGLKARTQLANARAGLAANNVDVNSGSAADVQVSQRELGDLDTATVANNAARQAYGYKTQATGFNAQSELDQSEVAPDIEGGVLKGVGSALSNSSVDSLLSGSPTLPDAYQWMAQNGGGDW